jgi:acetamidase/formamidase
MPRTRIPAWCIAIALAVLTSHDSRAAVQPRRLLPTPQTVTWGYFDPKTPPALHVKSGETLDVETLVAAAPWQLEAAGVKRDEIQPALLEIDRRVTDRMEIPHVLTGPVYIDDAHPGDVLEVKILSIEPAIPYAVNFVMPGRGFLPDEFPTAIAKKVPLDLTRHVATFAPGVTVPIRPFFGVVGVAPPLLTGRISSGPPWIHGGNLDNKELVAGTTLYLPVHVDGALFSIGDGHAAQGDGEVCVTAMETSLRGSVQLTIRKDLKLRWPRAETPTHYMTMGFHENLEEATKLAVNDMLDFLVTEKKLSRTDAYILASDAVDLRITQLVDGKMGVHALLPKNLFAN